MATKRICAVDDCDKPARTAGLCQGHYLRRWRYGDPHGGQHNRSLVDGRAKTEVCSVSGCGKPTDSADLCSGHYHRLFRYGDPEFKPAPKQRGACTLDGCDRQHYGRGFCLMHYKRWAKYGDPLAGSTPWGAVQKWVSEVAVPYSGDDCLIFPYSRDTNGYPKMKTATGNRGAHVVVTERTYGPKPTPSHEACHSCGNGHLGCVNPRHLRWGTRTDNVQDAIIHGTARFFGRACTEVRHD